MKDVKEASPIELAEYAMANHIDNEPAFAWWVPYTLKKRNRIIAKDKTKYWKTTHKYGLGYPRTLLKPSTSTEKTVMTIGKKLSIRK